MTCFEAKAIEVKYQLVEGLVAGTWEYRARMPGGYLPDHILVILS